MRKYVIKMFDKDNKNRSLILDNKRFLLKSNAVKKCNNVKTMLSSYVYSNYDIKVVKA